MGGIALALLSICLGLLVKLFWDRRQHFVLFQSAGIPGPEPSLLFGNLREIIRKGFFNFIDEKAQRYGNIWGYFEGYMPVLVVADAEVAKQILIKNFHRFHSRKAIPVVSRDPNFINVLDALGDEWKRLRRISSPSFSARRMKEMSPLINKSVGELLEVFRRKRDEGKPFNIHAEWQRLTMDTIASCAFGIEADALTDNDSVFLYRSRKIFRDTEARSGLMKFLLPLSVMFPSLNLILRPLAHHYTPVHESRHWFYKMAKQVIEDRQQSGSTRTDFIQLMLDAHDNDKMVDEDLEVNANNDGEVDEKEEEDQAKTTPSSKKRGLTMNEMQANSFMLMVAGYETTSSALAFSSHELARHPEIQKKLQMEIDEYFPEKCCPDYITVHKLPYLDMVFNEVLRKHPIATLVQTRECFEECKIENYVIPKGTCIQIDAETMHQNAEFWGPEDPKLFVPERFLPERKANRHPLAFMSFGNGPRNCIGMRFALMEAKIALARVLKEFNIEKCAETKHPLPIQKSTLLTPSEGVYVKLTSRT